MCSSACTATSGEVASRDDSKSCSGGWRRWDWGVKQCIPGFFVLQISTAFSDLKCKGTVMKVLFPLSLFHALQTCYFEGSSWRLGSANALAWAGEAAQPHLVCQGRLGWCLLQPVPRLPAGTMLVDLETQREMAGQLMGRGQEQGSHVPIFINNLFLSARAVRSQPLSRSMLCTWCHTNGIKTLSA